MRITAAVCCVALGSFSAARAHEGFIERDFSADAGIATIAGTYLGFAVVDPVPCVVIAGGTLSQTRDGRLTEKSAPPRDALRRLAEALAMEGYASLRFDRVGYGASKPAAGWKGTYHDEARALAGVIQYARQQPGVSEVIVAGESAGAYLACLAAKDGVRAEAYIFLGGFCGPEEEMYEYNFGRLAEYVGRSPANLAWAEQHARRDLAMGRHYKEMLAAAAAGKPSFELVDGTFHTTLGLERRREELTFPPDQMFRYITAATLAVAGQKDLNVPPAHAARIARVIAAAGNTNVTSLLIAAADHSFQRPADSSDEAFRERYTFASFKRPYNPDAFQTIAAWLRQMVPSDLQAGHPAPKPGTVLIPQRAFAQPELDPVNESRPERLQLAPGVEIVEDIRDKSKTAGVDTLEGRIGPLLLGEGSQSHFISMPAGLYLAEHAHNSESLIYTVSGQWVLCSGGRRHLMKPGSLFRFGANIATGYEVPFAEEALILIFKGERSVKEEEVFIRYLQGLAGWLKREQKSGVPYLLRDLPAEHPARVFAREVNPGFGNPVAAGILPAVEPGILPRGAGVGSGSGADPGGRMPPSTAGRMPAATAHHPTLARTFELPGVRQTRPDVGVPGRIDHLAYDPATDRLFVAALENNSLEVLDLAQGQRIRSLGGLSRPQGATVVPTRQCVAVACGGDGVMHVFDTRTLEEKTKIEVGPDADNVRYDAQSDTVLVSFGSTNRGAITVFDVHTWKRLREITFSSRPESFQLDPHGPRLFANLPKGVRAVEDGSVAVADRTTGEVQAVIPLPGRARNFPMAFDATHDRLFIASRRPARVIAIDTKRNAVIGEAACTDDSDDLFYDAATQRVLVIGGGFRPDLQEPGTASPCSPPDGMGALDLFAVGTQGEMSRLATIPTAPHARTGLFVPSRRATYLAAPFQPKTEAQILEYRVDKP